jgi:hypothetical protein
VISRGLLWFSRRLPRIFPQIGADFPADCSDFPQITADFCADWRRFLRDLRENLRQSAGKSAPICGVICANLRENPRQSAGNHCNPREITAIRGKSLQSAGKHFSSIFRKHPVFPVFIFILQVLPVLSCFDSACFQTDWRINLETP